MLKLEYTDYTLDFKFDAGTSRGVLTQHRVVFIKISDNLKLIEGYGEAAPLPRLSVEDVEEVLDALPKIASSLSQKSVPEDLEGVMSLAAELVPETLPSLRFAIETALLDLINAGKRLIFASDFSRGDQEIPINGLIWMGDRDWMKEQVDAKLQAGYRCIKVKVGAIDWEEELFLIDYLRSQSRDLIIRLDANGGFANNEVFKKLSDLEPYHIHSIEQPIMPRQLEAMQLVCKKSKIPIALDEELIGVKDKKELLSSILPSFIILKPTLLGGIKQTLEWIYEAEQLGIDWWLTSALESNVGLNAISQLAGYLEVTSFQGLGTGQLYHNNVTSGLKLSDDHMTYNPVMNWKPIV